MAKVTLNDVANLTNQTSALATINGNSDTIAAAIENTLSRDGTSPNTMEANLDMNSNRITNLPSPASSTEPATKAYVDAFQVAEVPDGFVGLSTFGETLIDDADAATARGTLSAAKSGANTDVTSVALSNTGLTVKDTDASHTLAIVPGSNLTADRTLTVVTGDANRSLTLGSDVSITTAGAALLDDVDAAAQRTTLGLGTVATQAAGAVTITGGSVTGITDITVADGGTGASTQNNACRNLGTWRVIAQSGAATARNSANVAGDATEANVVAVTIPGGVLGPNGVLRVTALWTYSNSASTKAMRIRFGGLAGSVYQSTTATTAAAVRQTTSVWNTNTQSAQAGLAASVVENTATATANVTSAVDTSADTTVNFTAAWGAAASGENITLRGYLIEVSYGA